MNGLILFLYFSFHFFVLLLLCGVLCMRLNVLFGAFLHAIKKNIYEHRLLLWNCSFIRTSIRIASMCMYSFFYCGAAHYNGQSNGVKIKKYRKNGFNGPFIQVLFAIHSIWCVCMCVCGSSNTTENKIKWWKRLAKMVAFSPTFALVASVNLAICLAIEFLPFSLSLAPLRHSFSRVRCAYFDTNSNFTFSIHNFRSYCAQIVSIFSFSRIHLESFENNVRID